VAAASRDRDPAVPAVPEAADVVAVLRRRGETLACAESLTGGLVSAAVTDVPGASAVLRGGVVSYATDVKAGVLGVDRALLAHVGAVDADVARQMAKAVRRVMGSDWGVATTGVAGPDPQDGAAVGTVFVAVAGLQGARAPLRRRPPGDPGRCGPGRAGRAAGRPGRRGRIVAGGSLRWS